MKMTNELFCKNIKTLREKAGLSQEQAAEAVGVNIRTYQRYEAGDASPTDPKKELLAKAFRASISDLYSEHLKIEERIETSKAALLTSLYSIAPSLTEAELRDLVSRANTFASSRR